MPKNQTQRAKDSDSGARGKELNKPVLDHSRETLGTKRIFRDPFIDGQESDLLKSKLTPEVAAHIKGYRVGNDEVTNQYGPDNRGNMPQLGERTKASKRQTVIPHRSLK